MVSIHKALVIVLLNISVICFIFRFKCGVTSSISLEALVNPNVNKQYPPHL